jgi:hypothetical protein
MRASVPLLMRMLPTGSKMGTSHLQQKAERLERQIRLHNLAS